MQGKYTRSNWKRGCIFTWPLPFLNILPLSLYCFLVCTFLTCWYGLSVVQVKIIYLDLLLFLFQWTIKIILRLATCFREISYKIKCCMIAPYSYVQVCDTQLLLICNMNKGLRVVRDPMVAILLFLYCESYNDQWVNWLDTICFVTKHLRIPQILK